MPIILTLFEYKMQTEIIAVVSYFIRRSCCLSPYYPIMWAFFKTIEA